MVVAGDVMVEGVEVDLLVSNIYTESNHIKQFTECFIYKTYSFLLLTNIQFNQFVLVNI